jgi:hypothetical protein
MRAKTRRPVRGSETLQRRRRNCEPHVRLERRMPRLTCGRISQQPSIDPDVEAVRRQLRDERFHRPKIRDRDDEYAGGPKAARQIPDSSLRIRHVFEDPPAHRRVVRALLERVRLDVPDNPLVDTIVPRERVLGHIETDDPSRVGYAKRQIAAAAGIENPPGPAIREQRREARLDARRASSTPSGGLATNPIQSSSCVKSLCQVGETAAISSVAVVARSLGTPGQGRQGP